MKETVYRLRVPFSLALLADLHDRPAGSIVQSLQRMKPEIICIAGDIVHRFDRSSPGLMIGQTDNVMPLLSACREIAPTFFSPGNHEWILHPDDYAELTAAGAEVLDNRFVRYKGAVIGGLTSAGVTSYRRYRAGKAGRYPDWSSGDRPDSFEPDTGWLSGFCGQDGFRLLLCHHPEYRDRYLKDLPIDLILSGHAHGGQIRLFGRGLYAPGQGLFPKYTGGVHGNMVISRGLANTGGIVPRLFNRREIVYILPN